MKTKELKRSKGITLIALIITIIVLLILAGVTIATLTGENGILTRATVASEEREKKGLREEIELAIGSNNIREQVDGSGNLEEELNKINGATVSKVAEDVYYVERDGNGYTVYEDGTIEEGKVDVWDGTTVEKPEVDEQGNWHIYTTGQMKFFANYCNDVLTEEEKTEANMPDITETTTVYLENNIDMGARQEDGVLTTAAETQWTPIDNFDGIFDGKNHVILGIYVNENEYFQTAGLFISINLLKNTTIKDSYVEINFPTFMQYVGGLACYASNIINCHNVNTVVKCTESKNISRVGGIFSIPVTSSADSEQIPRFENCTNSGKIKGVCDVGGIGAGSSSSGSIKIQIVDCINTGEIIGTAKNIGGIVGFTYGGDIENCYNEGKIIGLKNQTGGIVGGTYGNVKNSYNNGTVEGKEMTGGIIGVIGGESTIEITNCYNKGKVAGTTDAGTIVGKNVATGTVRLSNLYYLSNLGLGAIGGQDIPEQNVVGVSDDINNYEEFLTWIESK